MDAGTKQLADIFNGNRLLEVPYYQRSYVWKEEQWQRFLSDMEYITSTGKDYFLGSVILKQQHTGIGPYDQQTIIDGQQRFTTLAIFFKCLCLKTDDMETFDQRFTVREGKDKKRILAIRHSINDRKDFEEVIGLDEDKPIESATSSNIFNAYNFFQANIDPSKLDVYTILSHAIFIGISVLKDEDEQVIFDTINSLGVKLTTGELLKNYFFTESTREEYEELWVPVFEKDRETENYWDSIVNSGRIKRANIDFFFSAYLFIRIQDPEIKVSTDHKIRYRRAEGIFNNYKDFISNYGLDKKNMLYDILEYAMLYQDNINPDIAAGEIPGTPGIERMNFLIFVLEYTTLVPYTLYLLKNVTDKDELNAMFGYIESYVMRRQICRSDNKNFSDLFAENLINNRILTVDALKDYIENRGESQALAIPRDSKLERAFHTVQLPNKKSLAILYLMETALREGQPHATQMYNFDAYSLEHLMPKQWEANWPLPDGVDANQRSSTLLTLGNLSLLPMKLNAQISNAAWKEKKEGKGKHRGLSYYATGIVTLADALNSPDWDEDTISKRASWLAGKAMEIWPSYLPEESEDEADLTEDANSGSSESVPESHDYTKYSLNGSPFYPKRRFVHDMVQAYLAKYPEATFAELKKIFTDDLCSPGYRFKGLLCTEEDYNAWDNKYKDRRYAPDLPGNRLLSADGITFFVNTQWTKEGMEGILRLAKKLGFKVTTSQENTQPTL